MDNSLANFSDEKRLHDENQSRLPEFLGQWLGGNAHFKAAEPCFRERVRTFLKQRRSKDDETPQHTAANLSLSGHLWLVEQGRELLSGRFTTGEFATLLNVLPGYVFDRWIGEYLVGAFWDDFGRERPDDVPEEFRGMTAALNSLSAVERCALAAIIELIWHVLMMQRGEAKDIKQVAQAVGLRLRD